MSAPEMVIIGAGQAGARAALTLREEGWSGPITLIGKEDRPPYERPPLSKAVLTGAAEPGSCTIVDRPALAEIGVAFISGVGARAIDLAAKAVTLADGRRIHLEAWRNAETQGALAARNMLGAAAPIGEAPWFQSDQYDATLRIAGLPSEGRETIARENGAGASLFFHLGEDGRLVGASAFGPLGAVAKDLRIAQMLIERRSHPDPRALSSAETRLKSFLSTVT